jgi:ribosomal protein S18 acetylase RimI-like enzyme
MIRVPFGDCKRVDSMVALIPSTHISSKDIQNIVNVLFKAFRDYPLYQYLFPNPKFRKWQLPYFFKTVTKYAAKWGEIIRTSENYEGIMLLLRPPAYPISILKLIWNGAFFFPFRIGIPAIFRLLSIEDTIDSMHLSQTLGPHLYLWMLAVNPQYHGQKHGKHLLQFFLNRIKTENIPGYLETSTKENVQIYSKFGFV